VKNFFRNYYGFNCGLISGVGITVVVSWFIFISDSNLREDHPFFHRHFLFFTLLMWPGGIGLCNIGVWLYKHSKKKIVDSLNQKNEGKIETSAI
jgi:hypothetical protein